MKVHETLNMAADLIEEQGWGQAGETWDGTGGLCVEGGIAAVMGVKPHGLRRDLFMECPAYKAVETYLGSRATEGVAGHECGLYRWNDQEGRTAEEVIEVLRAAAVIEQAREESTVKQLVEVTA